MSKRREEPNEITDRRTIGLTARNVLKTRFPGRSVDLALTYPEDAIALCEEVRRTLERRLENHVILQALLNERKKGNAPVKGRNR